MSRVRAVVDFLTHDSIAGVAYGIGLLEYDSETERLLLANFGEEAVREAERMVEQGCADWYVYEIAARNPLDVAELVLRREAES